MFMEPLPQLILNNGYHNLVLPAVSHLKTNCKISSIMKPPQTDEKLCGRYTQLFNCSAWHVAASRMKTNIRYLIIKPPALKQLFDSLLGKLNTFKSERMDTSSANQMVQNWLQSINKIPVSIDSPMEWNTYRGIITHPEIPYMRSKEIEQFLKPQVERIYGLLPT